MTGKEETSAVLQRGVGAVEVAAVILEALHKSPEPLGVTAIAQACGFAPAQVHHYLVSLLRTGLVRKLQSPARYGLGPLTIRLGLTAVDRLDVQHFSAPFLHEVSAQTEEASFFSIWSPQGPVIVRWEQGRRPLTVFARLGTTMPVLHSATGLAFCAWGPQPEVTQAVDRVLRQTAPAQRSAEKRAALQRIDDTVRAGCGATRGAMLPDVSAVCAPVFDRSGAMAGALTVLGLLRSFDADPSGPVAQAARATAARLSAKLGYAGDFYHL